METIITSKPATNELALGSADPQVDALRELAASELCLVGGGTVSVTYL